MSESFIMANGKRIERQLPCTLEAFLIGQSLLPRSVVVEHNGEAQARQTHRPAKDRLGAEAPVVKELSAAVVELCAG